MGTFASMKNKKLDPWFCIVCDLETRAMKLPLEMDHDPWPGITLSDRMVRREDSARIYVRAKSARSAKVRARAHFKAYVDTRHVKTKGRVAA